MSVENGGVEGGRAGRLGTDYANFALGTLAKQKQRQRRDASAAKIALSTFLN